MLPKRGEEQKMRYEIQAGHSTQQQILRPVESKFTKKQRKKFL